MTVTATVRAPAPADRPGLEALRRFVEHEADLLDERRFDEWRALFADDGVYWVPASPEQTDWRRSVSLFYDDKHTLGIRIQRLKHPKLHCQSPESRCVRVVSGIRLAGESGPDGWIVRSKFVMLEDRLGAERRVFGGRYSHTLRREDGSFRIVLKRVDLTNCDASFPMLTQPF